MLVLRRGVLRGRGAKLVWLAQMQSDSWMHRGLCPKPVDWRRAGGRYCPGDRTMVGPRSRTHMQRRVQTHFLRLPRPCALCWAVPSVTCPFLPVDVEL